MVISKNKPGVSNFSLETRGTLASAIDNRAILCPGFISAGAKQPMSLTWIPKGFATIRYESRNCDLQVSTQQMLVLLAFNTADVMSLKQLAVCTGLAATTLANTIYGLSHPFQQLLVVRKEDSSIRSQATGKKHEHGGKRRKTISPGDFHEVHLDDGTLIHINAEFQSISPSVPVLDAAMLETQCDRLKRRDRASNKRFLIVDATIIALLKRRHPSTVELPSLTFAVKKACRKRFPISDEDVHSRVQWLASESYLALQGNSTVSYHLAPYEKSHGDKQNTSCSPGASKATGDSGREKGTGESFEAPTSSLKSVLESGSRQESTVLATTPKPSMGASDRWSRVRSVISAVANFKLAQKKAPARRVSSLEEENESARVVPRRYLVDVDNILDAASGAALPTTGTSVNTHPHSHLGNADWHSRDELRKKLEDDLMLIARVLHVSRSQAVCWTVCVACLGYTNK